MIDLDSFRCPGRRQDRDSHARHNHRRKAPKSSRSAFPHSESALLLFLMLLSENITLRDHDKADQRILISLRCAFPCVISISPGSTVTVGILGIKSCSAPILRKILRQPVSPGTGCRKQHDPISILLPALQILYKQLKAVIIRTDRANRHIEGARSR